MTPRKFTMYKALSRIRACGSKWYGWSSELASRCGSECGSNRSSKAVSLLALTVIVSLLALSGLHAVSAALPSSISSIVGENWQLSTVDEASPEIPGDQPVPPNFESVFIGDNSEDGVYLGNGDNPSGIITNALIGYEIKSSADVGLFTAATGSSTTGVGIFVDGTASTGLMGIASGNTSYGMVVGTVDSSDMATINNIGVYAEGNSIGLYSEGDGLGLTAHNIKSSGSAGFGGAIGIGTESDSYGVLGMGNTAGVRDNASDYLGGLDDIGVYSADNGYVGGDFQVDGILEVSGNAFLTTSFELPSTDYVTSAQFNTLDTSQVYARPTLYAVGYFTATGNTVVDSTLTSYGSTVIGNDLIFDNGTDPVQISLYGNPIKMSYVGVDGDLHASGAVSANQIGNVHVVENSTTGTSVTASCGSGESLMNCSAQDSGSDITSVYPTGDTTCQADRSNTSGTLYVYAYCFNPSELTAVCTDGTLRDCGSNLGQCEYGTQTCSGGQWGACAGETLPSFEVCDDNIDNDCNGFVDTVDDECAL